MAVIVQVFSWRSVEATMLYILTKYGEPLERDTEKLIATKLEEFRAKKEKEYADPMLIESRR